jgi:hypothetical protein
MVSGFKVKEVRDAPDRPGKEFVFIATPAAKFPNMKKPLKKGFEKNKFL